MSFIHHKRRTTTVAIASGASASSAIALDGVGAMAIAFPSAFTGTSVSFKSGAAGSELPVYQDGSLLTVPVTVSKQERVPTAALIGESLIILSNGTEAAARTITVAIMDGI